MEDRRGWWKTKEDNFPESSRKTEMTERKRGKHKKPEVKPVDGQFLHGRENGQRKRCKAI